VFEDDGERWRQRVIVEGLGHDCPAARAGRCKDVA
jgi:hypothetical protein